MKKSAKPQGRIPREFNLFVRLRSLPGPRWRYWAALALAMILGRIVLLPLLPIPEPLFHDEFSYLLAADTFAHGRVTNPSPAHAEFFESPHVLVRPFYISKFPPGQGALLAAGQRVFGHPYWGVVLSGAAMIFLFCWAANAWLPPHWTLAAGGLAWVLFFVRSYWFTSYWGGALAACGGALVIGGLGYFLRSNFKAPRFSLASGAAILAFTRPYEGAVLCAVVLTGLVVRFFRLSPDQRSSVLRQVVLPSMAILSVAAALGAAYDLRTTGRVTDMPYLEHVRAYDEAPVFWFLPAPATKAYSSENLRWAHEWELGLYQEALKQPLVPRLLVQLMLTLTGAVWLQFLAFGLLLFGLPWTRLRRKRWLVLAASAGIAALLAEVFKNPHYSAPFTATLLILIVASMRTLWYRMAASRLRGPLFVASMGILAATLFVAYLGVLQTPRTTPRAMLLRQLIAQGGRHLVLVDYAGGYAEASAPDAPAEWVYNGADPAASPVLFAHLHSDAQNRQLFAAYPGRTVWVARFGPDPSAMRLTPYSESATR